MIDYAIEVPTQIIKRDNRIVSFDIKRITRAIQKCYDEQEFEPMTPASDIAQRVVNAAAVKYAIPSVEQVQDLVELTLQMAGEYKAAKAYILYRAKRNEERLMVSPDDKKAFAESAEYFPTALQQFQFYDKYSRFNYDTGRRETWVETVARAVDFLRELSENKLDDDVYRRIHDGILNMDVMPSMRLLAMAGPAARRNNLALYNCSYMAVDSLDSFVEALIISMSGCGVGFSVEAQYINKLPIVQKRKNNVSSHTIADSSEGWANAVCYGITEWFDGAEVDFDFSLIRPAGSPLMTKGGRASGAAPLKTMLEAVRKIIFSRQGQRLRPIDAHDIMCHIGNAAVAGGVRRTAMISLFDYDDLIMRHCKSGDNITGNEQRWNANNSAVWTHASYSQAEIMQFVNDMVSSKRGEPGIFSRWAANKTNPARRLGAEFGINPCGEIKLRNKGLCNLSSVVCRASDTLDTLKDKVELATIIGTIQSMATNFPLMRKEWVDNCIEERLLGVDLNGQMDCRAVQQKDVQIFLKNWAVETNKKYAEVLGINQSASVTTTKPSGNSSTLVNSSSGIHARWSPYYVRNVRLDAHSPLYKVLKDAGVPMSPENGQAADNATTWVVHFPVKSPDGAIVKGSVTALQQCEYWLQVKQNYTEHNPSVTITYKADEVLDLANWIYKNQGVVGGMAFLPSSDASYEQMPYEAIDKDKYKALSSSFPDIDFSRVTLYEHSDLTTAAQELACMAGGCDI